MKKIISIVVLCLLLCGSALALISCSDGLDEGRYVSSDGIAFEVVGDSFVFSSDNVRGYADYEIDGDKLRLSFDKVEYVGDASKAADFEKLRDVTEAKFKNQVCRTFEFEKVEDGVILDGLKFTKI